MGGCFLGPLTSTGIPMLQKKRTRQTVFITQKLGCIKSELASCECKNIYFLKNICTACKQGNELKEFYDFMYFTVPRIFAIGVGSEEERIRRKTILK